MFAADDPGQAQRERCDADNGAFDVLPQVVGGEVALEEEDQRQVRWQTPGERIEAAAQRPIGSAGASGRWR